MESKSALSSKTMWTNLLLGLAGLIVSIWPAAVPFIGPEKLQSVLLVMFPVLNMVLRLVSSDKIYLVE